MILPTSSRLHTLDAHLFYLTRTTQVHSPGFTAAQLLILHYPACSTRTYLSDIHERERRSTSTSVACLPCSSYPYLDSFGLHIPWFRLLRITVSIHDCLTGLRPLHTGLRAQDRGTHIRTSAVNHRQAAYRDLTHRAHALRPSLARSYRRLPRFVSSLLASFFASFFASVARLLSSPQTHPILEPASRTTDHQYPIFGVA